MVFWSVMNARKTCEKVTGSSNPGVGLPRNERSHFRESKNPRLKRESNPSLHLSGRPSGTAFESKISSGHNLNLKKHPLKGPQAPYSTSIRRLTAQNLQDPNLSRLNIIGSIRILGMVDYLAWVEFVHGSHGNMLPQFNDGSTFL